MAEIQHTQTRPKFEYIYVAMSLLFKQSANQIIKIRIFANTELEATNSLPLLGNSRFIFAGRLPAKAVSHA